MITDERINSIICGSPVEEHIEEMLQEGRIKDFLTGKTWKHRVAHAGIIAATGYGAYRLYKRIRRGKADKGCDDGVSFLENLILKYVDLAKNEGIDIAVDLILDAIKAAFPGSVFLIKIGKIVKWCLKKLVDSKIEKPTKDDVHSIVEAALRREMPRSKGTRVLDKIRKSLNDGYERKTEKINYVTWLTRLYTDGVNKKMPVCLLILLNSDDQYRHSLTGVSAEDLINEFDTVLHLKYPSFPPQ